MKKILRYLLLMVCLVVGFNVNTNAAENVTKQISLTGISDVMIYTADIVMKVILGQEVNLY